MAFAKFMESNDEASRKNFFASHPLFYEQALRIALRKFVLSNLCTFKTHSDEDHFHEEYVIPQLLTEAIRLHKYDGILFPSTQYTGANISFNGTRHSNFYKSNLAMFTNYSHSMTYDQELMDNFEVTIITKDIINGLDTASYFRDINNISAEINAFLKPLHPIKHGEQREQYLNINDQLNDQLEVYKGTMVDGVPYLETVVGKIELYGICDYLKKLYFQATGLTFI